LITFLLAFVYSLIIAHARTTMRITYFYFGPTEIRALLLVGNLLALAGGVVDLRPWLPPLPGTGGISIHDFAIVLISLAGVTAIALHAIGDGRVLAAEDPPPPPQPVREPPTPR
jgi:hypothetical protein